MKYHIPINSIGLLKFENTNINRKKSTKQVRIKKTSIGHQKFLVRKPKAVRSQLRNKDKVIREDYDNEEGREMKEIEMRT